MQAVADAFNQKLIFLRVKLQYVFDLYQSLCRLFVTAFH